MTTQIVLGLDIGGTSADLAFIDMEGKILHKENILSHEYNTANSFVQLVKQNVTKALAKHKET